MPFPTYTGMILTGPFSVTEPANGKLLVLLILFADKEHLMDATSSVSSLSYSPVLQSGMGLRAGEQSQVLCIARSDLPFLDRCPKSSVKLLSTQQCCYYIILLLINSCAWDMLKKNDINY